MPFEVASDAAPWTAVVAGLLRPVLVVSDLSFPEPDHYVSPGAAKTALALRHLNRDSRVIDTARDWQRDAAFGDLAAFTRHTSIAFVQRPAPRPWFGLLCVPTPTQPIAFDGSHRLAAFRELVDIAREHTSYTSRADARRAVRLRPADRFVEIGSRVYVRDHGFDHHTCGARPGTATLTGSSTPAAPPLAA